MAHTKKQEGMSDGKVLRRTNGPVHGVYSARFC